MSKLSAFFFTLVVLCGTAFAQEPPKETPAPARGARKTTFSAVANSATTTNKIPKYSDTTGSVLIESTNLWEVGGLLGVGTQTPQGNLHLFGTATSDVFAGMGADLTASGTGFNFGYAGASFGVGAGFFNVRPAAAAVAPNPSLRFATGNVVRMIITNTGRVGIGASFTAPTEMLDVQGNINVSGNINAKYQDVAEWVDSATDLSAGTVVVLDPSQGNKVMTSEHAYDTAVAGVVSAQPGIILGEAGKDREKVATTGRVRVRVDATKAPIHIGDLLVSSDTPGMAMRSEPISINGRSFHQPGTIIGKALESLESGKGEILVLLTLQ